MKKAIAATNSMIAAAIQPIRSDEFPKIFGAAYFAASASASTMTMRSQFKSLSKKLALALRVVSLVALGCLLGLAACKSETPSSKRADLRCKIQIQRISRSELSVCGPLTDKVSAALSKNFPDEITKLRVNSPGGQGWSQKIAKTRNDVATRNGTAAIRRNRNQWTPANFGTLKQVASKIYYRKYRIPL